MRDFILKLRDVERMTMSTLTITQAQTVSEDWYIGENDGTLHITHQGVTAYFDIDGNAHQFNKEALIIMELVGVPKALRTNGIIYYAGY